MIQGNSNRTFGLVAKNTTTYVEKALSCMSNGDIVVPLASKDDTYRIDVAHVDEVLQVEEAYGWMKPQIELRDDDAVAQILFTSGTEGDPKGVVLTHRALSDVVKRLNSVMEVSADIREYIGVPVYHSFGFGRCRAVAAAGGSVYIPAQGFNPVEINQLLEAKEINAISAVPSLWRILLNSNAITNESGARVRWIEIGSQYMSREEKLTMKALFPNAKIVQHYGLTEASRSTFLEVHIAPDDKLESVGRGYGDVEVALADDGRIKIRGPHVTHMLIQSGKQFDPRDEDGWLTTNDLGEMDGEYLYYKGRSDDVINCSGLKLPPDALEAGVRSTLNRPGDFAICRVPDPMRGDGILVAAASTLEVTDAELTAAVVSAAAKFNVNASGATRIYRIDTLPRTATGKIQRKEITRQYLAKHPLEKNETEAKRAHVTEEGRVKKSLREEFCGILGVTEIKDDNNFTDSGGDSLGFIQASMAIQRYLGYLPHAWENMSIAQLEALPRRSARWVTMETSAIVRALAIVAIVVNHADIFNQFGIDISGSAFMLVIPMGFIFARFQLQRVLKTEQPMHALSALPRIMIPAFLLALAHELKGGTLYPSVLLFFNNLIDPHADSGYSFWFINIFVQLTVIYFL
ncbi:MAG: AMP-binding protein, partial [Thioalkalispiraceae bacterium]